MNFLEEVGAIGSNSGGALAGGTLNGISFYDSIGKTAVAGQSDGSFATGVTFGSSAFGDASNLTSTSITGDDFAVANNVSKSSMWQDIDPTPWTLDFHNLTPDYAVYVQVWGGVATTTAGWLGTVNVVVNGGTTNVWDSQDDSALEAYLYGFEAVADGSGDLSLSFTKNTASAGHMSFGGIIVQQALTLPATDPALSPETVDENVAADTLVGTLSMLETSGDFTYSLPGGVLDNDSFKLDDTINRNVVTFADLDFETKPSYEIRVVATEDVGGAGQVLTNEIEVSINDINDAPTAANKTVTTAEDTSYVFSTNDFNFADEDATESNTFVQVKVTTLETSGALEYNSGTWGDVTLNQEITAVDIDAGKLRFVPATNAYGTAHDTFEFKVHDGDVYSAAAYTMQVDVTQVNDDAPILIVSAEVGVGDTAVATLDSVSEGTGVTYAISGGANQGLFSLTTGGILTKSDAPVGGDVGTVYEVEVQASDNLGSTKVLIKVTVISGIPMATIFLFQ